MKCDKPYKANEEVVGRKKEEKMARRAGWSANSFLRRKLDYTLISRLCKQLWLVATVLGYGAREYSQSIWERLI